MHPNPFRSGANSKNDQILLTNDSFNDGRNDRPYSGNDWDGHMRGRNEKQMYDNATRNDNNKRSSTPISGEGGNCVGQALFLAVSVMIVIPSFFAALISGSLVLLLLIFFRPSLDKVYYSSIYSSVFFATLAYAATGVVLSLLQIWLYDNLIVMNEPLSMHGILKYYIVELEGFHLLTVPALLKFHGISVFVSALFLQVKLSHLLKGFMGFITAIAFAALLIMPAFLLVLNAFARFLPKQFEFVLRLF